MNTKEIMFNYSGGKQEIPVNVTTSSLPLSFEIQDNCDWLSVEITRNIIKVDVSPNYDYKTRENNITIKSSTNLSITLIVKQDSFSSFGIMCDKTIVLHHSYFDMNDTYNLYVTIYGGDTQELECPKLKNYITKVWDNSNMYNDFIIKIPRGLVGTYTLKHSEYSNYKKYCKEHGIKFDESKVKATLEIVQIEVEGSIGEMKLSYNDKEYTNFESIPVEINYNTTESIDILSTKYYHQLSMTKYEIVDTHEVDLPSTPSWIKAYVEDDKIKIKGTETNNFEERNFKLKVTNKTNSHQFVYIDIKQK